MTHWGYWSDAGVRPRSSLRRHRSACLPGEGRTAGIGHDVHRGQPQRARARSRGDRPAQPLDHPGVRTWPPRVESAAGQARGGRPCRCAMSTAPRKTATATWSRCAPCQPADSRPIAATAVKCPGRSQRARTICRSCLSSMPESARPKRPNIGPNRHLKWPNPRLRIDRLRRSPQGRRSRA